MAGLGRESVFEFDGRLTRLLAVRDLALRDFAFRNLAFYEETMGSSYDGTDRSR